MIASEIHSDTIPALSINDSAKRALYLMGFFKVTSIPIVNDGEYIGMLNEEQILDIEKEAFKISECNITKENNFVDAQQHIYNIISKVDQYKLSLVAVVDDNNIFLGTITPLELISATAKITSIDPTGGIIVLKMGIRDYTLGEIAQICENNQIKILSSYVQSCKDQVNIKLIIKLNTNDLVALKLDLERYNYKIESIILENRVIDELEQNRLDEFLHYLNM